MIEVSRLQNQTRFLEVAEERRRLARDLHDSVTQTLFSLSMTLDGLLNEYQNLPAPALDRLDFIRNQAAAARKQMRAMIHDLRPLDLGKQSLDEAIRAHTLDIKRATDISVDLNISQDTSMIPTPIQYNLERITQETLSNVARHAKATEVKVSLVVDQYEVKLEVFDNGIGFSQSQDKKDTSFGLMSIRERVEVMGGNVIIDSHPGRGTHVTVLVPLRKHILEDKIARDK